MTLEESTRADRQAAKSAVAAALTNGTLVRPETCSACGKHGRRALDGRAGIEAHHTSYAPEDRLNVVWLCVSCQRRVHRSGVPEPVTGRIVAPPAFYTKAAARHDRLTTEPRP